MPGFYPAPVAYFSMEICLEAAMPTYSGGLGVLAGDMLRSAADLEVPMIGVTLLHRRGYFHQQLDASGQQHEIPESWNPEDHLEPLDLTVAVEVDGRAVRVRPWRYSVRGLSGHIVPVYLLDTDLPENSDWDRTLTDQLYGGDSHYRLCQEIVLGLGGAAMLQALGHDGDLQFHINEGHAALLMLMLLERQLAGRAHWDVTDADLDAVRRRCVFTTHTPVPAGHDAFPADQVRAVLGAEHTALLEAARALDDDGALNLTHLALRLSRYVNAVALRHRQISQGMFPDHTIDAITNGVHATTWTSPPFESLFDRFTPEWRGDNVYLRYAIDIPAREIHAAHAAAKRELMTLVAERTGTVLDPAAFTIGFARRATPYKRADLIFSDLDRLRRIGRTAGPIQIVFGGKAHPRDQGGKALIRHIFEAAAALAPEVSVVYLENYEMDIARRLVAGADLWLNNPMKPLEAAGTSGMKAALNGVPSFSVLDGWWIEGHVEGVTGWSIGLDGSTPTPPDRELADLYGKLEQIIVPLYYGDQEGWARVMRNAIALNGSFFNTQRVVSQYLRNAYFPAGRSPIPVEPLPAAGETIRSAWAAVR